MQRTALRAAASAALALFSLSPLSSAIAGPAEALYSPTVEQGEREVELSSGSAKLRDGTRINQTVFSVGYGVTDRWFTELAAVWHKPVGERTSFDAWEWENRFQLTETGRYPVDVGFLFEVERPKDRAEGYELRWGPLFQAELGTQWQANLNLLLEKHVRTTEGGPAELGYQWQLKYRWKESAEFALQGLGDVGPWRHWEPHREQPHSMGPAVLGHLHLGPHQSLKYDVGLLLGMTDAAPRRTLRAKVEFEF